ncbi:NlpBDapX family lipoprotein [Psychromonas ingrahamii 37]|uniref:Outer membrane protein assembly factor BamC n=1 Tax=Psychromonas ingrahamii (strain DSM 17664 / CCUG 51855 / 37) TaxID=357804 RepID=BAMC_PSYIN|nr:outer membrane protein assembly factor BamC [Psychromonas ingrahamii]A1SVX3.1 RecName: Full=Outer membrane protein assembly factor BamC; Flags: Precursor [Psychromonas ingrahamii 37]ABM03638.1 NlpBDapX family lipoprotein [Psychromonas ingrahamii 37]
MSKFYKSGRVTTAVIVALSLSACARFDARTQANGDFDYVQTPRGEHYQTAHFTQNEARDIYDIPALTEQQKRIGFLSSNVDIRPPTQLIPVIDGVVLEANNSDKTTVLFNAFNHTENMKDKVWTLLESYIAANNIEVAAKDSNLTQIETGMFRHQQAYGSFLFRTKVVRESSYRFTLNQPQGGQNAALTVEVLSYSEKNDNVDLKVNLTARSKKSIELRLVNDLLKYAYQLKESSELQVANSQPLPIKLGYDDNNQMVWIVDADFIVSWTKLPDLLALLRFEQVDADKNLGYYLVKFKAPNAKYWPENNLNSFELDNAEYFIQLGELNSGSTSITWLDADKKPLADEKVTEIYFSITSKIRDVLLLNENQSKAL